MNDDKKLINYLLAGVSQSKRDPYGWRMPEWVPARVRMLRTVRSDLPTRIDEKLSVGAGQEYEVESNKWGAVSAKIGDKFLGLIPHEFEVLEWVKNPHSDTDGNQ